MVHLSHTGKVMEQVPVLGTDGGGIYSTDNQQEAVIAKYAGLNNME